MLELSSYNDHLQYLLVMALRNARPLYPVGIPRWQLSEPFASYAHSHLLDNILGKNPGNRPANTNPMVIPWNANRWHQQVFEKRHLLCP